METIKKLIKSHEFWFYLIILLGAGGFYHFIQKESIDFVPIFFIVFLILMYSFSKVHHYKLAKPSGYLIPLFIALSISFAIISLTFGIHSDVFASYDNNETNKEDRYKWFKADEVLHFPISQLKYKNNPPDNKIDFTALQDSIPKYYIIVIDKTKSVKNASIAANLFMIK